MKIMCGTLYVYSGYIMQYSDYTQCKALVCMFLSCVMVVYYGASQWLYHWLVCREKCVHYLQWDLQVWRSFYRQLLQGDLKRLSIVICHLRIENGQSKDKKDLLRLFGYIYLIRNLHILKCTIKKVNFWYQQKCLCYTMCQLRVHYAL